MHDLISYRLDKSLALISWVHPPLDATTHILRASILEACQRAAADRGVKAIILYCGEGIFSAGGYVTDIVPDACLARPDLPGLLSELTRLSKPLVAAIGKQALGSGLELALACGYRVGVPATRVGFPEIKLGLLPSGGGTQRLPRLIGAESALNLILSGEEVDAHRAQLLGILDRVAINAGQLLDEARAYAYELISRCAPARPADSWSNPAEGLPVDFFERYRAEHEAHWKSRLAPRLILTAINDACTLPLSQGLAHETELFKEAFWSPQSAALRHVFSAEQETKQIPGKGIDVLPRKIEKVAVVGAGNMGSAIAMIFANAGVPVVMLELEEKALKCGLETIRKNYANSVKRGKLSSKQMQQRLGMLSGSLDYANLVEVDLVIDAVLEKGEIKQKVLRSLDSVCKAGTILATCVPPLDFESITTNFVRPQDVVGMHLVMPADSRRLIEVVPCENAAPDVLVTAMKIALRIDKLPVVCNACFGTIGNRMLDPYVREAHRLVLEGASPAQVEHALSSRELNLGVFSLRDREAFDATELYALNRYGYEGCDMTALADRLSGKFKGPQRQISDQEIHDRCLFTLINEGIQLLDERIVMRPGDIDLYWVNHYGFPAHLGGPMYYAEQLGLDNVLSGIEYYRNALGVYGEAWFQPASLLVRLAVAGKSRIEVI